jgi:hypothetical protein
MGLRFRRRFTIGPGLRLNVSKSGISTSVGRRGLWFTLGHGKTRETVGLPGSGLSYTEQQRIEAPASTPAVSSVRTGWFFWLVILAIAVVAFAIWR